MKYSKETGLPECKCGNPCMTYGDPPILSVMCKECSARNAARQRVDRKLKKGSAVPLSDYLAARITKSFKPHVWVRPDIGTVEIALEDVPCHHEWIKGEGADISIWRARDDNRVVGVTLPLRTK